MAPAIARSVIGDLAALEADLQRQLRGRVAELTLVKRDEWLVVRGFSYTYYAKQLAQHALMARCSYPLISNEIEVLPALR